MRSDILTGLTIVLGATLLIGIVIFSIFSDKQNEDSKKENLKQSNSTIEVQQSWEGNSNELPSSSISQNEDVQLNEEIEISGGYSYSQTDLDNSKETALKFIEAILPYNAEKPYEQLDNPSVLQWGYSETLESIRSALEVGEGENIYPTKAILKRTLDTLEVVESDFYHTDEMYINVLALTTLELKDGTSRKEEYFYNVFLEKNMEGIYKVSSIYRFE